MTWKRVLAAVIVAGFGLGSQAARAEDPTPKKADAAAKPVETPKPKDSFFGKHFAMYLETRGGPASFKTVKNPLTSGAQQNSLSELNFNGNKSGQFTVGWTLPRGRGQYLLTYNGIADGDFELDATGTQQSYNALGQQGVTMSFLAPWWHVTIRNGQLQSLQIPPVWLRALDDANGNLVPDPDELRYPTTALDVSTTVPKDLGNRIQTWDLAYRREFGGLKIRCRWTAGLRYLDYQGAILTPSWLTGSVGTAGFGYSDGVQNRMLIMQQKTTGWGPEGSGEIDFNFFRQRLTLYALVQAAFLTENLTTDSGAFTYFARIPSSTGTSDPNSYIPGSGNISDDVTKSSWNNAFEAGVRVRLLDGFFLIVDWNRTGYLDAMLIPNDISIPQNASQTALGTTARFISRDFIIDTATLGLSFQF